jgi:hypothetical protein
MNIPSEHVDATSVLSSQELEAIKQAAAGNVTSIKELKER